MYCSHCGEKNDDGARFCKSCNALLFLVAPTKMPFQSAPRPSADKDAKSAKPVVSRVRTPRIDLQNLNEPKLEASIVKAAKPSPAINPFGDAIVIEDDRMNPFDESADSEEVSQSHWGARITMVLMLIAMLAVVFANISGKATAISDGGNTVYSVFAVMFLAGTILCGVLTLLFTLFSPYKNSKKIVVILIASVAGIVAETAAGSDGMAFVPAIVSTVVSVLLLIFNSGLAIKESVDDEIDFGSVDTEANNNPLL
ncbi:MULTISPECIES: zinc ribbon domain-containing protein [unclassified Fibrobacter]|uniref:zinc ribbon domain-containing protein n=1 Tax=unclassified Fibrobacter TaxID=2634177 RepID=UPI000D6C7CD0|nr:MULTISPECIES: zinc ribbon domain-containing protein [unclassified Fibrobacter]PWJ61261.1 zinc ribbon protein [Fibrobacter sp. UWR4]PZW66100.1 zinc ribbon protein [Fibrobacter sp. UWR1]